MAKFKPFKVTSSQLKSLPIVEGQLIFVTDTFQTFLDINGTTRTEFNGSQSNTCFDMIFHGESFTNSEGTVSYGVKKEEALKLKEQFEKAGKTSLSVFFGSRNTYEGEYANGSEIFGYGEIKVGDFSPRSLDTETTYSITNGFLLRYEDNAVFTAFLGSGKGNVITFTIDDQNGFYFEWPYTDYELATTENVKTRKSFILATSEPSSAIEGDVWGIVEK